MENNTDTKIIQPTETTNCLGTTKYRTSTASVAKIKFDTICIFFETMVKWFARVIMTIVTFNRYKKLKYLSKAGTNELYSEVEIYQEDLVTKNEKKGVTIQNGGHATSLVQMKVSNNSHDDELRVMIDPLLDSHLDPILYRAQTRAPNGFNETTTWDNIGIDAIVISHNHRDHFDIDSLKVFAQMEIKPLIVLPVGLKRTFMKKFRKFGFTDDKVVELNWGEKQEIIKAGTRFSITATPCDHWSERTGFDTSESTTNGYLISNDQNNEMIYYSGDTARMEDEKMDGIEKMIERETQTGCRNARIPLKVTSLLPAGPNHSRKYMRSSHMSVIESLETHIRLIIGLHKPTHFPELKKLLIDNPVIFTHHNKYELGIDRFNEAVNVLEKVKCLLEATMMGVDQSYKDNDSEMNKTQERARKIQRKHRFIFDGMRNLQKLLSSHVTVFSDQEVAQFLYDYIETCIQNSFPKIGQKKVCESFELSTVSKKLTTTTAEQLVE